jgi:hypothetical protein
MEKRALKIEAKFNNFPPQIANPKFPNFPKKMARLSSLAPKSRKIQIYLCIH